MFHLFIFFVLSFQILKLWTVGLYDLELTFQNEFLNKHRDAVTCAMFHTVRIILYFDSMFSMHEKSKECETENVCYFTF